MRRKLLPDDCKERIRKWKEKHPDYWTAKERARRAGMTVEAWQRKLRPKARKWHKAWRERKRAMLAG